MGGFVYFHHLLSSRGLRPVGLPFFDEVVIELPFDCCGICEERLSKVKGECLSVRC